MAIDPKYKAVAFDMDGTFMDTVIDYVALANSVFDTMIAFGIPESMILRGSYEREVESGTKWLVNNGRGNEIDILMERISERTNEVEMEHGDVAKPYTGAVDVLTSLRRMGYKTGILTRGGKKYASMILKNNNIWDLFDVVIARDDFPMEEAKPSPKAMINLGHALGVLPSEILFMGDHKYDWLTARDSGAGFYGVLTGGYTMQNWIDLKENVQVIKGVASLLDEDPIMKM